jgi:DHA2 family multidrug resistance protein
MALGAGLVAASFAIMAPVTADWSFWELFAPQALRGFGIMFIIVPVTTLALGDLPPEAIKNASGLLNLMRNMGGAFGLAALNTVILERTAFHASRIGEWANAARPQVQGFVDGLTGQLSASLAGNGERAAVQMLAQLVHREAAVMTFSDAFLIMAGLFALMMVSLPVVRRARTGAVAADAH